MREDNRPQNVVGCRLAVGLGAERCAVGRVVPVPAFRVIRPVDAVLNVPATVIAGAVVLVVPAGRDTETPLR